MTEFTSVLQYGAFGLCFLILVGIYLALTKVLPQLLAVFRELTEAITGLKERIAVDNKEVNIRLRDIMHAMRNAPCGQHLPKEGASEE